MNIKTVIPNIRVKDLLPFRFERERFRLTYSGPYLAAFFLPILVMLLVFLMRGFYPFGDRCFLRTDLYHQYAPFFRELKTKFNAGESLMYSWRVGGGTNFWVLTAYYLASPLNVLVLLAPKKYIIEFVTSMIVIKLGICSVTMTYYINNRHGKRGFEAYPAVAFGVFYALSGYMAAYQWNVMWLDCLWLFPLVILGLERLVKENKGMLYCLTFGLTVLSNYYIAIMVSMGIACYCFFLLGTEKAMRTDFGIKLLKFIGYTVLGLMFAALFLVPYISYFGMTASADNTFKFEWYSYFSVFDMFSRHLLNVDVHTGLDHWPNIYCGMVIFLCLPLYYMNKRISLREKIGYTLLLIFFYFSFSTRSMDYIWHGFHIPNSLPCRQAFIYIFIILVMSYRGFTGIRERSYRDLTVSMMIALAFIFLAEKLETDTAYYHIYTFYVSALFVVLYALLAYAHRRGRMYKDILIIITLMLVTVEAFINTTVTSVPTVSRSEYMNFDEGVHKITKKIEEDEGGAFYRAEKAEIRTKNDGAWLSYPSISTFSSCANANLTAFYKYLGLESSTNAYGSTGQTPFTDMLQGVKYLYSLKDLSPFEGVRTLYDFQDGVYAYRNDYVLPLGFALPTDIDERWSAAGNPMDNQNMLAGLVSNVYDLFVNVTDDYAEGKTITLTIPEDGFYYAYSPKSGPKEIKVTHADYTKTFKNLNRSYTMDLGFISAGTAVTFENKEDGSEKNVNVSIYRFDAEKLPAVFKAFSRETMVIDSYDETHLLAHITVEGDRLLWTTIASEDGWTLLVDGEECEFRSIKDAYMGIPLTAGTHTISLSYRVPYLTLGIILHVLAILIMLGIWFLTRIRAIIDEQEDLRLIGLSEDGSTASGFEFTAFLPASEEAPAYPYGDGDDQEAATIEKGDPIS